jgi:hypothetical protein
VRSFTWVRDSIGGKGPRIAEAKGPMINKKDLTKQGLKAWKYLNNLDKDDVLEAMGLEERSSGWSTAFGTIGIFALGCLVGAGIGLAFAPKPGSELLNDLGERVRRKADDLNLGQGGDFNRSQMPVT